MGAGWGPGGGWVRCLILLNPGLDKQPPLSLLMGSHDHQESGSWRCIRDSTADPVKAFPADAEVLNASGDEGGEP